MRADELKRIIKKSDVTQWKIAETIGMSEFKLCRKLRGQAEISKELETSILRVIALEKAGDNNA